MHADARRAAFERLFRAHVDAIRRYARRRAAEADAEEIVAETFEIAWRRLDRVPEGAELPWLYGVAGRVLANQRRGADRRRQLADRVEAMTPRTSPDGGPPGGDEPILEALAMLRAPDRELLCLMAWEGLERDALAQAIGVSRASLRVRIHRARRALRAALDALDGPAGAATRDTERGEDADG